MDLSDLFHRILVDLEQVVPFQAATVFMEEGNRLRVVAAKNYPADLVGRSFAATENALYQEVRQTRRPLVLHDAHQDSRFETWWETGTIRAWMGVPLIVNECVRGLISIDSDVSELFTARHAALAQVLVNHAAFSIEKTELAEKLSLEKRRLELLYDLSQSLTEELTPEVVAQRALQITTRALGGCLGAIYLLPSAQAERLTLLAAWGYTRVEREALGTEPYLKRGCGVLGATIVTGVASVLPDVTEDRRWIQSEADVIPLRSAAYVPLVARNELVGILALTSRQVGFFQPEDLPTFQAMAAPIALALQNARLLDMERRRRNEADMLRNATAAPVLNLDLEQILNTLLDRLQQAIPFDSAAFLLLRRCGLHVVAGRGYPASAQVIGEYFPTENEMLRRLQIERKPIYYRDVSAMPEFQAWGGTDYVRGWMGVPLIHRNMLLGYLTLDSRQVGSYGEAEAILAQAFANQAAITLVNAQLFQESQQAVLEQRLVSDVLRQLNATTTIEEVLRAVAGKVRRLSGCDEVEIGLLDGNPEEVVSLCARWAAETAPGNASDGAAACVVEDYRHLIDCVVGDTVCRQGRIYQNVDLATDANCPHTESYLGRGYTARVCVPLRLQGRILGYLQMFWRQRQAYERCNPAVLNQVADAVAMTVERNHLFVQTQQRMKKMEVIAAFTAALRPLETGEAITEVAINFVLETFGGIRGCIYMPAEDPERLEVVSQTSRLAQEESVDYRTDNSIVGRVFLTGEPQIVANIFEESDINQRGLANWRRTGYRAVSAIVAPLHTGKVSMGVISIARAGSSYTREDLDLLTALASIIGTALHRVSVLETLEQRVSERTQELAEANERLRELDRLKSEFVANVSHELRTPLTNIRLYLNLVNQGRSDKREHYLSVLQKEADRLSLLIESILDLSRLNAVRIQGLFQPAPIDMVQTVNEVIATHHPLAAAKEIQLLWSLPAAPLPVAGDRGQLVQIVTNLLSNAINYTQPGGTIGVELVRSNGGIQLTVQDTGMGLDPEELPHLFDRFYRSQRSSEMGIPGTGLGLSIVKEIVDLHQGQITACGEPDVGSTFRIWLPSLCEESRES